jgi:alkylmercury lyase
MQGTAFSLEDLAEVCVNAFPPFDEQEQRIVTATYRALVDGAPVGVEQIARTIGLRPDEVHDALVRWNSLVHFDREGRVVALIGLDLSPSTHRFEVNGRTLYTWCAWDTLFIPRALGETAHVESVCPITGRPVRLLSTPDGVRELEPAGALVSFVTPERAQVETDVIASFCCHVHFLSSVDAGDQWLAQHEGSLILSVDEAWQLGRICVEARLSIA